MIQAAGLVNMTQSAAVSASKGAGSSPAEVTQSFSDMLKNAIDGVDSQEKAVHNLTDKFLVGNTDLESVMVASQQAELSLKLTAQVRNRVIEAYQEVMRTQM